MTTTKEDCDALRLLAKNVPDLKHYAGGCDKTRGEFLRRIADKLEAESARADKLFADAMDARKKLAAIRNAMPDVQLRLMAAIKQISIAGGAVIDINQAIQMITDALKGSNASDCLPPVTDPEREAVLDQAKSVEAAEHKPRCMTRLERVRTAGLSCKNLLTQTEEYAKRLDKLDASPITPKLQAKLDEKQKVIDKLVEKLRDMTATRDDIAQELRDNVGAQKQAVTDPDKLFDDAAQDSLRAAEEAANNPAGSGDCGVYTPPDTETIADQARTIRDCQDRCAEYSNRNDELQGDHDQAIEDLKDMDRTIHKQALQIRSQAEQLKIKGVRIKELMKSLRMSSATAARRFNVNAELRAEFILRDTFAKPCEQCRVLQLRLDAADERAKSWHFASDENLTAMKLEEQKNATIRNDLAELRGFLDDLIGQASRDDGVDVGEPKYIAELKKLADTIKEQKSVNGNLRLLLNEVRSLNDIGRGEVQEANDTIKEKQEVIDKLVSKEREHYAATDDDGAPTSRPWVVKKLKRTDDRGILFERGYEPLASVGVVYENELLFATHCVNSHDALMAACKAAEAWFATEVPVGYSDMRRALSEAIEKGDVKP